MPFSFTFKLSVPGLSNPFSAKQTAAQPPTSTSPDRRRQLASASKSPSPLPISRKRGWEPAFAEPSRSTTSLTATATSKAPLVTPKRYREMQMHEYQDAMADDADVQPPAKRRRGLAGSIVTTALNAALISTAVGLTMYRLWRDRGRGPERLPPPPPYQQGEWTPEHDKQRQAALPAPPSSQLESPSHSSYSVSNTLTTPPVHITPATPRNRKPRHPPASAGKRSVAHRRTPRRAPIAFTSVHAQVYGYQHPNANASSPAFFPAPQPEFDFARAASVGAEDEDGDGDDQMDWIGDKLSMLIEEGKKALGREVVVMSDSKEDEVDDGTPGVWEEEDDGLDGDNDSASVHTAHTRASRSGSMRRRPSPSLRHRPQLSGGAAAYATPSPSPSKSVFDVHTPPPVAKGRMTPSASFSEDRNAWESPEMRESMERARAKVLAARGTRA